MGKKTKNAVAVRPARPLTEAGYQKLVASVCKRHRLTSVQLFEHVRFAHVVRARADLYVRLCAKGVSDTEISRATGFARSTIAWTLDRKLDMDRGRL